MTASQVNQLNRAFTVIFTDAMQSIRPKTDIEKLRNENTDKQKKMNESYRDRLKKWQSAFAFRLDLRSYINNLSNMLVLTGSTNSEGKNSFTEDSLVSLEKFLKSDDKGKSFTEYMDSCIPKYDISKEEKLRWEEKFTFPSKIDNLVKKLTGQVKRNKIIPSEDYCKQIDEFIKELISDEDEFLIEETDNVGGEGYAVNSEIIATRAKKESEALKDKIHKKVMYGNNSDSKISEKMKNNFLNQEAVFTKIMKDAKSNQLEVKAKKKILEKKYDNPQLKFEIDIELAKKGAQAAKKHFPQYMNYIAAVSIAVILALAVSSVLCIGCTSEIVSIQETIEISSAESIDGSNLDLETASSEDVTEIHKNTVIRNPATEILESELILILISTFVAPIATRVIKEKFDIDVTEKQISMVMADGIKATTAFAKEADKLRDENGHIPRKYQKTLRDKAFTALRANYTKEKYADVVSNVGSEIFEKAIESAVASGKLKKFPLEKKQVELLIKQSITAYPGIIEWQKLDEGEEIKKIFINGNIRKLLQNAGINGWSYSSLENMFDAEANQRLINATIIEKSDIFKSLDWANNPYLKYAITAIDAFLKQYFPAFNKTLEPTPNTTPQRRQITLEIDKIAGTQFPPANVNFEGKDHSLTTIFDNAGIDLHIIEDEMDIPDTFGPKFTQAELLSLMRSHQNAKTPKNHWSAYMVIVPEFTQSGVLGIMFDSPTRKGCAVFHNNNFIRNDERAFLRTAAHELGHQLNLHHEDGTSIQTETVTKRTIMNQTRLIKPWPEAILYEFSNNSKTHLTNHPENNVKPGGSNFYDCNEEHSNWHSRVT